MNVHDSEYLRGVLESFGLESGALEEADLILLNTCSVRENPEQKARSLLGKLRRTKEQKPDLLIGIAGCMAARTREELGRLPFLDLYFGPEELETFPRLLADLLRRHGLWEGTIPRKVPYRRNPGVTAFLNITIGCDNFCSYCVVPYVRGREWSRSPNEIVQEAEDLANCGFKEMILLGQNVNAYGRKFLPGFQLEGTEGGWDFARLLQEISTVQGIERIRYMTSHPRDFNFDLVRRIKELPRVCEHFHLPVQSGSNRVLAEMNRGYTREHFLSLIRFIREGIPFASITTDIIVGFPTENEEDFRDTLDLMREVRFDRAHILAYSPRPGTQAFALGDPVPRAEKERRLSILMSQMEEDALARNRELEGREIEVLVEAKDRKSELLRGRTRTDKEVYFPGQDELVGQIVKVKVEGATAWSLQGKLPSSS